MMIPRTYLLSLLMLGCLLLFGQCKKTEQATPTPTTPDPLADAAGIYTGNVTDTGRLHPNVKATVTTVKDSQGKLYVNSIGLSGATYQLVLANPTPLNGRVGSYEYRTSSVAADSKSLNVSGRYTINWNSSTSVYYDFSFTGTR